MNLPTLKTTTPPIDDSREASGNGADVESNGNGYNGFKSTEHIKWETYHREHPEILESMMQNRTKVDRGGGTQSTVRALLGESTPDILRGPNSKKAAAERGKLTAFTYRALYALAIYANDQDWLSARQLKQVEIDAALTFAQFMEFFGELTIVEADPWELIETRIARLKAKRTAMKKKVARIEESAIAFLELLDDLDD